MNLGHAARISGLVLASAGMALGVSCAFLAWKHTSLPGYMAATVLLLGCPAIAMAVLLAFPPSTLPKVAWNYTDRTLTVLRLVRAHVCAAASYVVVLGFCQLGGVIDARPFTAFYTVVVVIALAGYLPWLSRAETRLRERREMAHRALQEIRSAAHWSGG